MSMREALSLVTGLALAACSVVGVRSGTEEPAYSVVEQVAGLEIRQYGARIAAETVVPGDEYDARSTGFRRLAGYIFGGNQSQSKIAMTAPVAFGPAEKIAMTAPVAQEQTPQGWRIRFFMPAQYTLQTLPIPNDARVSLVTVSPETYAVYRYSGFISAESTREAQAELLRRLQGTAYTPRGDVFNWFYDPPWTLPPLRRNEAVVMVKHS